VTLRPIQHNDGIPAIGLFFTRTEFNDLVSKQYPSSEHSFDSSFLDGVFDFTNGHVGAIVDFIGIILAHDVGTFALIRVTNSDTIIQLYRTVRNTIGQSYTWSSFSKEVDLHVLVEKLENSASIFAKGTPPNEDL
jgi:hypothetical protein